MADWFAETALSGNLLLAVPVVAIAGLVSFFSPCVVPLLPGYLSYVSGVAVTDVTDETGARRGRMFAGASLFVLGFSAVFVAEGALFGYLGMRLLEYQRTLSIVMGASVDRKSVVEGKEGYLGGRSRRDSGIGTNMSGRGTSE